MRLFLASFAKLKNYQQIKQSFSFIEGKWVEKRNLHITYLFLGEVQTAAPIIEKLQRISYEKKEIPIIGLGFFGNPAKVLYANIQNGALTHLHNEILQRLGTKPDKPFIPHLTLCRIKRVHNFSRFITTIRKYEGATLGSLELELHLVQSHLTPKGPIYRSVATF